MSPINLGILKEQAFGLCAQCKSNHKCSHVGPNNKVYCGKCANIVMGVPHDTPADQQKLNEAIAKRDSEDKPDLLADAIGYDKGLLDNLFPEVTDEHIVETKSDVTRFVIRKLKTGLCLIYDGEEHFFSSKTGLIKHLKLEVL